MKFYSDKLQKLYDTQEECAEAERIAQEKEDAEKTRKSKLKAERAKRAEEIETAYKVKREADKRYSELVNNFIKDYGCYHYTYRDVDEQLYEDLGDLINLFLE